MSYPHTPPRRKPPPAPALRENQDRFRRTPDARSRRGKVSAPSTTPAAPPAACVDVVRVALDPNDLVQHRPTDSLRHGLELERHVPAWLLVHPPRQVDRKAAPLPRHPEHLGKPCLRLPPVFVPRQGVRRCSVVLAAVVGRRGHGQVNALGRKRRQDGKTVAVDNLPQQSGGGYAHTSRPSPLAFCGRASARRHNLCARKCLRLRPLKNRIFFAFIRLTIPKRLGIL